MRALRIVAEELLRPILTGDTVNDMHGLESILSDISSRSKTSHLCMRLFLIWRFLKYFLSRALVTILAGTADSFRHFLEV